MSTPLHFDRDDEIIDITPERPRRRRRWWVWIVAALILFLFVGSRGLSIYMSALWFGSLGYSAVYWYIFKIKLELFLLFFVLTTAILRAGFWLIERAFASFNIGPRTVFINKQPVSISPTRFLRPIAWVVAIIAGLIFGFGMREEWRNFALYFHAPQTILADPIFNKPVSFYLFTLPVYDSLSSWLLSLAVIILIAAIAYAALTATQETVLASAKDKQPWRVGIVVVSYPLAICLLVIAWRTLLSRYPYLWEDHQIFSGVTYMEANHLLRGLLWVAIALVIAAVVCVINAFSLRRTRILIGAVALPVVVYLIAAVIIPAYVTNFIVKPNELGREAQYIERNIEWTRRAFGIDKIEQRNFEAETSVESFGLQDNHATLDNIRLWDWRALQDTLKQMQAIRIYYDFPDVDVDRYQTGGQIRQMMIAGRELNVNKLPETSRNWINQRLIFTHGYGVTMNTSNEFTAEGRPRFILSNMPVEASASDIQLKRPQIYFGQETDSHVYVDTKQKEFDFPQGESDNYTIYEGSGGIRMGSGLRRLLIAWAEGDLSKVPFSDAITPDSRLLLNRNIHEIVNGLAPFLAYDRDPYIVAGADGNLYWIIDAFTETSSYPYSRHHSVGDNDVNYVRNSVKVVIDAYNGTTNFYVFDPEDPLIAAYRATFPSLFRDVSQMPADLRAHVRYPETLLRVQGDVFGLYHVQNPSVFFQQEDAWNVAQQVVLDEQSHKQVQGIDPYFVLMQLPGELKKTEFALILPFTPANRNNMIGWMAGRSDGEDYGKLLAYNFPKSRLIDGPLQIEARIDQNAQLSAQFSLWNQQGSRVVRGHLLVIPIGKSLLYVEPIYLKAESSPMPELRLVVLATQDRLGFGQSFDEAMSNLFGDAAKAPTEQKPAEQKPPAEAQAKASPSPAAQLTTPQLIDRAVQEFEEYQKLTAAGRLAEAGKKLEEHKRTLEELKRVAGKQ
ncbi:MAG TPA: UPF0182 family protein [Pyrinomonadaceae bacterium]|nr:UPF0182 family protein [Pyrinomonadaceae bacterium]